MRNEVIRLTKMDENIINQRQWKLCQEHTNKNRLKRINQLKKKLKLTNDKLIAYEIKKEIQKLTAMKGTNNEQY